MANEITDEQIMAAAYQHLPVWDQDHIRFARAVLALASHTGEAAPATAARADTTEAGSHKYRLYAADDSGAVVTSREEAPPTPTAATPAAPGEVILKEAAQWLHAAYDRPPLTPECKDMLARVDAALSHPAPVTAQPMFFASAEQANALQDRPDDREGGVYLPLRKTAAGKFNMPLYAAPVAAPAPVLCPNGEPWDDNPDGIVPGQDRGPRMNPDTGFYED